MLRNAAVSHVFEMAGAKWKCVRGKTRERVTSIQLSADSEELRAKSRKQRHFSLDTKLSEQTIWRLLNGNLMEN